MNRIDREKQVIETMVRMYCRRHDGNATLCPECASLLEYARRRLDHCRYGEKKPTCRQCPVHCYRPESRERMRCVMRWGGPRMMLYHPIFAIRHIIREL